MLQGRASLVAGQSGCGCMGRGCACRHPRLPSQRQRTAAGAGRCGARSHGACQLAIAAPILQSHQVSHLEFGSAIHLQGPRAEGVQHAAWAPALPTTGQQLAPVFHRQAGRRSRHRSAGYLAVPCCVVVVVRTGRDTGSGRREGRRPWQQRQQEHPCSSDSSSINCGSGSINCSSTRKHAAPAESMPRARVWKSPEPAGCCAACPQP